MGKGGQVKKRDWRNFFYQRIDTDDEIRIVYKSYASLILLEYVLCGLMLYGFFIRAPWYAPLAAVVALIAIATGLIYSPIERMLREAAADGRARTEGRKMSRRKPYTAIIQLRKRKSANAEEATAESGDGEHG